MGLRMDEIWVEEPEMRSWNKCKAESGDKCPGWLGKAFTLVGTRQKEGQKSNVEP